MIRQPHPTDGMSDKDKEAYFSRKTISREIDIPIEPRMGMVGGKVDDFTPDQKSDVRKADDLL